MAGVLSKALDRLMHREQPAPRGKDGERAVLIDVGRRRGGTREATSLESRLVRWCAKHQDHRCERRIAKDCKEGRPIRRSLLDEAGDDFVEWANESEHLSRRDRNLLWSIVGRWSKSPDSISQRETYLLRAALRRERRAEEERGEA